MAKEKPEKIESPEEIDSPEKKSKFNIKILLFGIPLFMLQLVVVYFVTANFLLNKWNQGDQQINNADQISEEGSSDEHSSSESNLGEFVYIEEDVIVNPANTQGKRLLLTSIGFDLKSEENIEAMKEKNIVIRDMIISTIASKTISQLNSIAFRDSLKMEISEKVRKLIPSIKVNKIYFSKYIIQ